ncbi:MAG: hypothetical protein E6G21_11575 [Actinobacteria bacterium]|nr:MAG: hypothetical protein E6G21_11575 [Actinomycetota bacterium]
MRRSLVLFARARTLTLLPVLALAAALAAPASASQLVNRDVRKIKLSVNTKGEALVSYRTVRGRAQHVLAWGAINARQPNRTLKQARFKLDYAGGWGKYHKSYWKTFRNSCGAYDGPALPWLVTACKAPDGSYWALQKWQVQLPDLGFTPWTAGLRQWELHLSHWTTDLAKLEVWQDWVYHGRFHHLFGRYTYLGQPVHGFGSTRGGAPTDGYGRLLYLDTHNSAYGRGWRRENAFLVHNPTGVFCYGFFKHDAVAGGYKHPPSYRGLRPKGNGDMYRLIAPGPGVTPDVMWSDSGLHDFSASNSADVAFESAMNAQLDSILNGDKLCRQH